MLCTKLTKKRIPVNKGVYRGGPCEWIMNGGCIIDNRM